MANAPDGPGGAPGQHPLRTEPRSVVRVQLPVSTSLWEGFTPLWTKDASRGGAFVLYANRVVPSSGMPCLVKLGANEVKGTVAHVITARLATATGADAGFGIAFAGPQADAWWTLLLPQQQPPQGAPASPTRTPTAKEIESAKNFYALGMSLYDEKNFPIARQKFELASRVAPDPRYEAMQAVCNGQQYSRMNLADKAREAFERALQLDRACAAASRALEQLTKKK